ncbi:hypothetical protein KCP70_18155 [Salmonella enterica subsp. enterica]|nr:hypothetical protein KCP70_18155 [Salmonella enterica subsp. enterica]
MAQRKVLGHHAGRMTTGRDILNLRYPEFAVFKSVISPVALHLVLNTGRHTRGSASCLIPINNSDGGARCDANASKAKA